MLHIQLRHIAAWHPHVGRMRKRRDRQMRAVRPSRRTELWYRSQLQGIVDHLRAAGTAVAHDLRSHWPTAKDGARGVAADETAPGLNAALQRAAARFGNIKGVAERIAAMVARRNLGEVDDRLAASIRASVGIDIKSILGAEALGTENARKLQRAMAEATKANVELITSLPDEYLDQVGDVVRSAWQNGARWESLVPEIAERGDVAESRAALIARDQTSKMNAAFNETRQTSLGIEKYTWSTSHDERVRDSHQDLDGEMFRWDDPPDVDGERVNPGEAINCRCVALPLFDLDQLEGGGGAEAQSEEEEQAA